MTSAEMAGIALGAIAIVAPALWPSMSKAISYPVATIGFILLGWSGLLALQDATGMKIGTGPLVVMVAGLLIAAGGLFWHISQSKSSAQAAEQSKASAEARPTESKDAPMGGKNNPTIKAGRDVVIGHIGDVIHAPPTEAQKPQNFGALQPGGNPTPLLAGRKAARNIQFGDSATILSFTSPSNNHPVLDFFEEARLHIELIDGHLMVSTQIFDPSGHLIAEMSRNEWKVAPPPHAWDRNYTDDALEVRGPNGRVVLQIRLLPDRIQLQGEWWSPSSKRGIQMVKNFNEREQRITGSFVFMRDGSNRIRIDPIFKYPSELHFGKLVDG